VRDVTQGRGVPTISLKQRGIAMTALIRRLAGAVVLLAVSLHASAAFEARWSRFGDNTVIHDTTTGLEWLRLDQTYGMSYDSVYAQLDTTFSGFTFATRSQTSDLVRGVGIPFWEQATYPQPQSLLDASHSFLTMFGALETSVGLALRGFSDWGGPTLYNEVGDPIQIDLIEPMDVFWSPARTTFTDDAVPFFKPTAYPTIGAYLVTTPVPEPGTYALMALGLAAVWLMRRRHVS